MKWSVVNYLSLRTSAHAGVAIPLLREEMYRKVPGRMGVAAIFGGNRYLVPFNRGIATTSLRTGLAMTGNLEAKRQAPICRFDSVLNRPEGTP